MPAELIPKLPAVVVIVFPSISILSTVTLPVVDIFWLPKLGFTFAPFIEVEPLISPSTIVPSLIIVDVTVPVSPVVTIVPVTSGIVIVLSAVGFVIASVVSLVSSVLPSKTKSPVTVKEQSLFK